MSNMNAATITKQLNSRALATRNNAVGAQPGLLQGFFARWKQRRQMRRDEIWLKQQPDYLLKDIGVGRAEIETMLRLGRYR
jgi:uncharacterized protein YjiS (DUF1127 family)